MITNVSRKNTGAVLNDVKNCVLEIIFKYIPKEDCVVFLYGSLAMGMTSSSADIDIGIFCREKISHMALAVIRNEIEEKARTLREIDVIDFSDIEDVDFIKIALKKIELWHQGKKVQEFFSEFRRQLI